MRSLEPSGTTVVSMEMFSATLTRRLFAGELNSSSPGGSCPERDRFANGVEEAMLLIFDEQT